MLKLIAITAPVVIALNALRYDDLSYQLVSFLRFLTFTNNLWPEKNAIWGFVIVPGVNVLRDFLCPLEKFTQWTK